MSPKAIINPNYSLKKVDINELNFKLDSKLRHQDGNITLDTPTIAASSIINETDKSIEVTLDLTVNAFSYSDSIPVDDVKKFAIANAPAIIFPNMRSVVSVVTMSSNLPPLQLQLINFHNVEVDLKIIK
jgi:preprotein translocase subunit SecB